MENESNISTNEIENFLVRRLGEKEGAEIMQYIHSEIEKNVDAKISDSKNEISLWRNQMKEDFATKEDAITLENKLIKRVSAVEGTVILWGFVFWITLIIAVYIIFKFMQ